MLTVSSRKYHLVTVDIHIIQIMQSASSIVLSVFWFVKYGFDSNFYKKYTISLMGNMQYHLVKLTMVDNVKQ